MNSSSLLFCWFSGTGNTRLVVQAMSRTFESAGLQPTMHRIGSGHTPEFGSEAALGLAFPVAYQSTYPFVWDFIDRLPPGKGREVFMVDSLGGFSGGLVGPMGRLLRKKGYLTAGAREIRMPMNFGRSEKGRRGDAVLVRRAIGEAEEFARDLLAGNARWGRIPVLSDLMFLSHAGMLALLFTKWNQRKFGIRTDPILCTGCSVCAGACPVGNIRMVQGEGGSPVPEFGARCEFCLHCVAVCSMEANRFPLNRHGRYRAPSLRRTEEPTEDGPDETCGKEYPVEP